MHYIGNGTAYYACNKKTVCYDGHVMSVGCKLHKAEARRNIASKILLFMRIGNMADSKWKSLSCLIAFSTCTLTLATVRVSIACCQVNFDAPLKKEGMVKNALFRAVRSLAVKPRSARMHCPGLRTSKNPLFSATNLSLELLKKPVDTKLNTPVNGSIDTKNLTVV